MMFSDSLLSAFPGPPLIDFHLLTPGLFKALHSCTPRNTNAESQRYCNILAHGTLLSSVVFDWLISVDSYL
jgi:hypothetical protein